MKDTKDYYLAICLALGAGLGLLFDQLAIGVGLGVAIGVALDQSSGKNEG